ncbi:pentalenic acid synthase [Kibdelosporangium banguiense]|uniref:Pentalenic acid synthase n=1 Tax=Kibdelosporangium banguiense TaxID=1365924 RepID=A0ABS4TW89_9PSEU|nr:cytochrome P450 [Kibdelosporangium banguiense]MBP2328665.1 pentalenic acid synthase [Kibdelosporangium banguiense]
MTVETDQAPSYPMARRCPFEPPEGHAGLRAEGPLTKVTLFNGRTVWAVTGHAEARAVLADPSMSVDQANPAYPALVPSLPGKLPFRMFVGMDDPEHAVHRRAVLPWFTVRRIQAMRPSIQAVADQLVDRLLAAGPPADLMTGYAMPLSSLVICEMLGVPYEDHHFFEERTLLRRSPDRAAAAQAVRELSDYLAELLAAKEADPGDDLLSSVVAQGRREDKLSWSDLVGISVVLLIAGHEPPANMIGLGTLALLEHPDQLAALRADPSLLPGAVDELLRYLSITDSSIRFATVDRELAGQRIAADDGVLVLLPAANRDSAAFADPDRLDVTRTDIQHVAFGHGIHQCLGQSLARLELEIAFGTLLRRLPDLALAAPADTLPVRGATEVQGVAELPVTW